MGFPHPQMDAQAVVDTHDTHKPHTLTQACCGQAGMTEAEVSPNLEPCVGVGMTEWTTQERVSGLLFACPDSSSRGPGGRDQSLKTLKPKPTDSVKVGNLPSTGLWSGSIIYCVLNKLTDYEKQFGKKVPYALAWPQRPPPPPPHLPETLSTHTPGPPHTPRPSHACTYPTCSQAWASRDPHFPAALPQAGICSHLPGRCRHSRAQKLLPGARLLGNLQLGGHSPSLQGPAGSGLPHPQSLWGSRALPRSRARGQTWPSFVAARRRGGGGRTEEGGDGGKK